MLKLARNALAFLGTIIHKEGEEIQWNYFKQLHILQEEQVLKMANKISSNHIKFEKHKMNVRLAAQTLSSSVADATEFLDIGMKNPNFKNSNGTVKFVRIIDRFLICSIQETLLQKDTNSPYDWQTRLHMRKF